MQAMNINTTQNNDSLFDAMHSRICMIQENSDNGSINEENFRRLTGGESILFKSMYRKGVTYDTPMKLTFFNNDQPIFTSQYANQRRVMNLPLRVQFLDPESDQARIEELHLQGKANYIAERDVGLKERLLDTCIPAVLRRLVQGAVKYYQSPKKIREPPTVIESTAQERKDQKGLFEEFVRQNLVQAYDPESDSRSNLNNKLSFNEILDVFCIFHNLRLSDIKEKLKSELAQMAKKILTEEKSEGFRNVQKTTIYGYPTRTGRRRSDGKPNVICGYANVTWQTGISKLSGVVNHLRKYDYKDDPRQLMAESDSEQ